MKKIRTFIGIKIPDKISSEIFNFSSKKFKSIGGKVKLVEKENIHITLLFLGEVENDKINQIIDELKKIKYESFIVSVRGLCAFPSPEFPKVVWIGAESDKIIRLHEEIKNRLKEFVEKDESKPFTSHITIARIKSGNISNEVRKLLSENKDIEFGKFQVNEFSLFESKLTPQGPIYKILESFKLDY
jgi:RNA 2',3'-cyclic 3'-phosphodiesterase